MSKALVLQAAGINCDRETARALELAGAAADLRHVNALDPKAPFDGYDLLVVPGGFSHGDDVAAGRILGDRLARDFGDALRRFVEDGRPILGICNGFQVLVACGLLPGGGDRAALDLNEGGRFVCRWVTLRRGEAECVWTADFAPDEPIELPVAHAEGRLVASDEVVPRLRPALVYAEGDGRLPGDLPFNPNASVRDAAGLSDATGLVLGLMPHPERYVEAVQHPDHAGRRVRGGATAEPAGLRLFRSAVARSG